MKNLMLFTLSLVVFVFFDNTLAQTYTVDITVDDMWWHSTENFGPDLTAVIYENGNPIPPSEDYFYEWHVYFSRDLDWTLFSGLGKDNLTPETMPGYFIRAYVIVSDLENETFSNIQSEETGTFSIPGTSPGDKAAAVSWYPLSQSGGPIAAVTSKHWRYTMVPAQWKNGYRGCLTRDHDEIIQASPNYMSSLQEKFLYWNGDKSDIENFNSFTFIGKSNLYPQYWSVYGNVRIKNLFTSAGGIDPELDSVEFKDPWLIDYDESPYGMRNQGMAAPFNTYDSPLNPTLPSDFNGVFLNRGNPPLWDKPHYSVKADPTLSINFHNQDIDWYFQHWEGNDVSLKQPYNTETAVLFQQSNSEAHAVYKGHLATNSDKAISSNNQRKIAYDDLSNRIHMIYEDHNEIYYTYSEDDGEIWSEEFRISDGTGDNKFPSILVDWPKVFIVWQQYVQSTGHIKLRVKDASGWSNEEEVRIMLTVTEDFAAPPVIHKTVSPDIYVIIWKNYDLNDLSAITYNYSEHDFGSVTHIPNTNSDSEYPALTADRFANNHLAWQESGNIYYTRFDYANETYYWTINKEPITPISGYTDHEYPCITTDYNARPSVVWHAQNVALQNQAILHCRRSGIDPTDDWETATGFYSDSEDYYNPSISGFPEQTENNQLQLAWSGSSQNIWVACFDGTNWTDPGVYISGQHANLSINAQNTQESKLLVSRYSTLPYLLEVHSVKDLQNLQGTLEEDLVIYGDARIVGDLTVPQGIELIILPGSRIFLEQDVHLLVGGLLTAIGTSEDKIQFTSVYSNPTTNQYWNWIRFNDSADDESKIKNSIIEYADVGVYTYWADISLEQNEIRNIRYYGIYGFKSDLNIYDNHIHDNGYGIYLFANNYVSGQTFISGNHVENAQRGIYLYRSSPKLYDNEINNCDYGLYCYYYSSANLGWIDQGGYNYLHHNGRGVYSYKSSPFLGQDMCSINGGYNKIESSSVYQVEAKSYSNILAEKNWWAYGYNFYQDATSTIDHIPDLNYPPFYKLRMDSPQESAFNNAFAKIMSGDTVITDEEVMESYDQSWPIDRKLNFARNLNFLGFPHLTENICRGVVREHPDSSGSYLAIDLLWQAGRLTEDDFTNFKSFLDSLAQIGDDEVIYEEAELIRDGFIDETNLAKRSVSYYLKFKSPAVASQALLDLFINALLVENDYGLAAQMYNRLKSEFPTSQATLEAINHLGVIQHNFDLPEDLFIPNQYELLGNYPNPFNPVTKVKFSLPKISKVEIIIFNILGQKVQTLNSEFMLPGVNELYWNGKNEKGSLVPSGAYIYRFIAQSLNGDNEQFTKAGKMILIK